MKLLKRIGIRYSETKQARVKYDLPGGKLLEIIYALKTILNCIVDAIENFIWDYNYRNIRDYYVMANESHRDGLKVWYEFTTNNGEHVYFILAGYPEGYLVKIEGVSYEMISWNAGQQKYQPGPVLVHFRLV